MFKLFLDTNVILDFFQKREPFYEDAYKLFVLAEEKKIQMYVCSLSFSNINYIMQKTISKSIFNENLKFLMSISKITNVDKTTIKKALDSHFQDLEDAIQYYSAIKVKGLNFIITRDTKGFIYSKIPIVTPKEFFMLV